METEKLKNLCAPIPAALHEQVRQRQGESGKNLGEYMTWLISVFGKSKCEQKGLQKVSTFSTRFYDVSKAFLGTKCSLLSTREDGAFCKSGCPGGQMLTSVPKGPLH